MMALLLRLELFFDLVERIAEHLHARMPFAPAGPFADERLLKLLDLALEFDVAQGLLLGAGHFEQVRPLRGRVVHLLDAVEAAPWPAAARSRWC